MPKSIAFSLFLFLFSQFLRAQTAPTEALIGTGTVQARIVVGGPLVTDFRVPTGNGGALVSAIKELSVWVGGIDYAGNLRLSIQGPKKIKTDFAGGFRDIPQSARVWKVTKEQVRQHVLDFADNGVVDNPIPEIFAWPGRGNPWSMSYNGFATDTFNMRLMAPVTDETGWWTEQYNPAEGHYPFIFNLFYNIHRQPDELIFVPFHVKALPAYFPNIKPIQLNCSAVFFTYYCDDADFLDHTVFGYVNMQFPQHDSLDSVFFSVRADGNIGNPNDDYFGFIPGNSVTYFYNADTTFDQTAGAFPPVVGIDIMSGIPDTFGNDNGIFSVMPLYSLNSGVQIAQTQPELPLEYYRYITGAWRDGSPLTEGGPGYNTGPFTNYIFPDPPFQPSGWSEISEESKPGDRQALISSGPTHFRYEHSPVFQVFFALDFVPGDKSLSGQWQQLRENSLDQELFFYGDFFPPEINPYDTLACFKTTSNSALPEGQQTTVSVFPNPASEHIYVEAGANQIQNIGMYDLLGRQVVSYTLFQPDSKNVTLNIREVPAGLYFLSGTLDNHLRFTRRLVVRK